MRNYCTRQIAETNNAIGMEENKVAGKIGGGIAKNARISLENKTGKRVISTASPRGLTTGSS